MDDQNPTVQEIPSSKTFVVPHTEPSFPPKKSFLPKGLIFVLIFLILILGAGGTYLALNSKFTNETGNNGTILGKAVLGPQCPAMKNPPEDRCKDKPYETTIVVKSEDETKKITSVKTDPDGTFTLTLPTGKYVLTGKTNGIILPKPPSQHVTIESGKTVSVIISFDTGIR